MSDLPETMWAILHDNSYPEEGGEWINHGADFLDEYTPVQYTRTDTIPTWQPIETAPKGESYLAYYPVHDMGRYTLPARITSKDGGGDTRKPTHWMPLPKPPTP